MKGYSFTELAKLVEAAMPRAGGAFSGNVSAPLFIGPLQGNADTATAAGRADKLSTARNITIGSTTKAFDGTENLSWSLAEIGAINASATVAAAHKWATPRALQVGNSSKAVDGTANVAWSLAEIGAVNKAGDTMTGQLTIQRATGALGVAVGKTGQHAGLGISVTPGEYLVGGATDGGDTFSTYLRIGETTLTYSPADGTQYKIYHQGFKPTPADIGAVNKAGDTITGALSSTSTISATQFIATSNGAGTNVKVGDDAWFGDVNLPNTTQLMGVPDNTKGYLIFGNGDSTALGRSGTGALTYGGNTIWHAGNDGPGSGLDADLLDGQEGAYYRNASNINAGTIGDAYLPATISSDITGNAATATKLATARTIGGVAFDGTTNINLPGVDTAGNQNTTGNASTASKLQTGRSIALGGDLSGSATFDGSANITITAVVADDSHAHVIANVDGLQTALDGKKEVAVLAGYIAHGGTIPLPSGFTEAQCKWIVSTNDLNTNNSGWDLREGFWTNHLDFRCYTSGRVVTATVSVYNDTDDSVKTYPSTANYIIIGVK